MRTAHSERVFAERLQRAFEDERKSGPSVFVVGQPESKFDECFSAVGQLSCGKKNGAGATARGLMGHVVKAVTEDQ